jgi:hypothetical protein
MTDYIPDNENLAKRMIDWANEQRMEAFGETTLKTGADMTPDEVARLVDRILTSEARVERIKEQCQSWIMRAKSEHGSLERWLRPVIADYMAAHPPKKGKTLHTPAGSVSLRTVPAHVSIEDEGNAMQWAKANHPHAVVTRESLSAAEIKAWVSATGEIPPGCVMVDDEERMYVRALKKGGDE